MEVDIAPFNLDMRSVLFRLLRGGEYNACTHFLSTGKSGGQLLLECFPLTVPIDVCSHCSCGFTVHQTPTFCLRLS